MHARVCRASRFSRSNGCQRQERIITYTRARVCRASNGGQRQAHMCVYTCIHTYVCVYKCIHTIHTYVCIHTTCVYACIHTRISGGACKPLTCLTWFWKLFSKLFHCFETHELRWILDGFMLARLVILYVYIICICIYYMQYAYTCTIFICILCAVCSRDLLCYVYT